MISEEKFNMICWGWIAVALLLLPLLLVVTQPYGRHTKKSWGPMVNNRASWFLMELPALFVFGYFLSFAPNLLAKPVLIAAILWGVHYLHRTIIFPFVIKTKGKKMPLVIVLFALIFNSINGFLNGYWLANFVKIPEIGVSENFRLVLGSGVFLLGFIMNKYHDHLLIKLRKSPGNGYQIPYGGLFKYISCPNFLGEIISWLGFFIVTLSLPALSFLVWTLVNLITRALDHHKWYLLKFPDYPKNRKAIIPAIL